MKKNDLLLFTALLVIFASIFAFQSLFKGADKSHYYLEVKSYDGSIIEHDLIDEGTFKIKGETGEILNTYEIKDGKVKMLHANCPDKLCVHTAAINYPGRAIICLPNHIFLSIKDRNKKTEKDGLDAIAK